MAINDTRTTGGKMNTHEPHTIASAMQRGELDEEEAFFVLRFAGRHGYGEAMRRLNPDSLLMRAFRWVVWFGGWERPHLMRWREGGPRFQFRNQHGWRSPNPVSILGHTATCYGWGLTIRPPWVRNTLTFHWRRQRYAYLSPDGTPSSATLWLFGKRHA
jgi:hypothetical protein